MQRTLGSLLRSLELFFERELRFALRLTRHRGGSVLLEQMTVFPMFAAIFLLSIYAVGFHANSITEQRKARACSWAYASGGCKTLPPGCPSPAKTQVQDADLRAAAQGGFETVASDLPFLVGTLSSLHGDSFAMASTLAVQRPKHFGGASEVHGFFSTMCNATTGQWSTAEVFKLTCEKLGIWCP